MARSVPLLLHLLPTWFATRRWRALSPLQLNCGRRPPQAPHPASLGLPLVLTALLGASPASAFDSLSRCNAWQRSHGVERILLGNAIGASNYLTKRQLQLESPPEAPIPLYRESDLQRVCSAR